MANKKYATQNCKLWTVNFSAERFVKKAQIVLPALRDRIGLRSIGLTVLLAVEFCLQEQIAKEFLAYVDQRRRSLL